MPDEANATEAPAPVLPYEPEPEHVTKARDDLKAANAKLNEALRHLDAFIGVFGAEAPETDKARKKVHEAQEVANRAAHDKSVVVMKHGAETTAKKRDDAKAALAAAIKKGADHTELHKHTSAIAAAEEAHADVSRRLEARIKKAPPAKEGK